MSFVPKDVNMLQTGMIVRDVVTAWTISGRRKWT